MSPLADLPEDGSTPDTYWSRKVRFIEQRETQVSAAAKRLIKVLRTSNMVASAEPHPLSPHAVRIVDVNGRAENWLLGTVPSLQDESEPDARLFKEADSEMTALETSLRDGACVFVTGDRQAERVIAAAKALPVLDAIANADGQEERQAAFLGSGGVDPKEPWAREVIASFVPSEQMVLRVKAAAAALRARDAD